MDQRPYRPIRGAARFLNSPLWSRVLRCTALPRIACGGALTAALLLSRYVSLSLGRFHCGTGRLCEGWRTAPRQRDWWLSYGHHGRFLGGGSGYSPVPLSLIALSAFSLPSFAGGITGVASGLPLGFQGGFPRYLLKRIPHHGPLARLSEPPHERQLRRLAQRPRQQPHELDWPTWRLFAGRCGHREPP